MSENSGHSEEKEDLLGNKYTQHYDSNGSKTGRSEEKEGMLGGKYTQHYDSDGKQSGTSETEERLLGSSYTQNRDESGNKAGWSETKERLLGDDYRQSYNESGEKTGWSEKKERMFGDKYTQRYSDNPGKPAEEATSSGSGAGSGKSYGGGASSGGGSSSGGGGGFLVFLMFACAIGSALKSAWDDWGKPPEFSADWDAITAVESSARQDLGKAFYDSSLPGKTVATFSVCDTTVFNREYQVAIREGVISWTKPESFPGGPQPGQIFVRNIVEVKAGADEYRVAPRTPTDSKWIKTAEVTAPFGDNTSDTFAFPNPRDRDLFIGKVIATKKALEAKFPNLFVLKVSAIPAKWSERVFIGGCPWGYTVQEPSGKLKVASEARRSAVYRPGEETHLQASDWIRFQSLEERPQGVIVSRFPRLRTTAPDRSTTEHGPVESRISPPIEVPKPSPPTAARLEAPLGAQEVTSGFPHPRLTVPDRSTANRLPVEKRISPPIEVAKRSPAPPAVARLDAALDAQSPSPITRAKGPHYTGRGKVYTVPELKDLVGRKLDNAWLRGDFALKGADGNTGYFTTVGLFGFAKEGNTRVEIDFPSGIELSAMTLRGLGDPAMVRTISYRKSALLLLNVTRGRNGEVLVKARAEGVLRL